jgi:hypothetical protein
MRRTAGALVALTMLSVVPSVAAAPSEGSFQNVFELATASWFERVDGQPVVYVAGAVRNTNPAGRTRTEGFADKLKCWEKRTKSFAVTICYGRIRSQKIAPDRLEFDPVLNETRVSFDGNQITWTGRGEHYLDYWPVADPAFGAMAEASLNREARAEGRVLGLDLSSRGWKDWGILSEGAFAGVITTKNGKVTYADDGTITFRLRFRRAL